MLMNGNYGDVGIGDYKQQVVNPSFVTVEAAPGQTPVFSTLYIRSTNKWVFKGIKVQSLWGTNNNKLSLVTIGDQGAEFPTTDIILENMHLSTADSTDGWTKAQWVAQGRLGLWAVGSARRRRERRALHDLHLDDRIAHRKRARRRDTGRPTTCFSRETRSTISATTASTMERAISRSPTTTSTTISILATAIMRTPCRG